jgi:hypothetical protein
VQSAHVKCVDNSRRQCVGASVFTFLSNKDELSSNHKQQRKKKSKMPKRRSKENPRKTSVTRH